MSLKNRINKYLRKFNVELHGLGYLQSLGKNEFKNSENSFYSKAFKSDDKITIFDVGANRGLMISNFFSIFPKATLHAFEPYEPYALELITNSNQITISV